MCKICSNCKKEKVDEEFSKSKSSKDGLQPKCKECEREYRIVNKDRIKKRMCLYYQDIKDVVSEKNKEKYKQNKDKILDRNKNWRRKNKDKERVRSKKYRMENKDRILLKSKQWREENLEQCREYQRNYVQKKRNEDLSYKIAHRLRSRIREALKSNSKSDSSIELLGCSIEEFRKYLESLFTDSMTWERFMNGDIEIDHIKPCCAFDLSKEEEQRDCFHYSNMRPLWWRDNRVKLSEDIKFKKNKGNTIND